MGYFSNGTEGMMYEERYCCKCVHCNNEHGCPVWDAHLLWNGDECNNKDSVLHRMIPRNDKGENLECIFYEEHPAVAAVKAQAIEERVKYEAAMRAKNGGAPC